MIRVGGTYAYGDLRFESGHVVFVVVGEGSNVYKPPYGENTGSGFLLLILQGRSRETSFDGQPGAGPGQTFAVADSSAIACDSVRFPAEE